MKMTIINMYTLNNTVKSLGNVNTFIWIITRSFCVVQKKRMECRKFNISYSMSVSVYVYASIIVASVILRLLCESKPIESFIAKYHIILYFSQSLFLVCILYYSNRHKTPIVSYNEIRKIKMYTTRVQS